MEQPQLGNRDCPDGFRRTDNSNLYAGTTSNDKTAAYSIVLADRGKCFSNKGASGSVTFTLPTDSTAPIGWWVDIYVVAAQTVVVAATAINTAASLTAASTQADKGLCRVMMGPNGKYVAILVGTWT